MTSEYNFVRHKACEWDKDWMEERVAIIMDADHLLTEEEAKTKALKEFRRYKKHEAEQQK